MEVAGAAAALIQLIAFTGSILVQGYGFLSQVRRAPGEISALLRETAGVNALLRQLEGLAGEIDEGLGGVGGEGGDEKENGRRGIGL